MGVGHEVGPMCEKCGCGNDGARVDVDETDPEDPLTARA